MIKYNYVLLILLAFILVSCNQSNSTTEKEEELDYVFSQDAKPITDFDFITNNNYLPSVDDKYSFYFDIKNYKQAIYEPENIYLGANITEDKIVQSNISSFDKAFEKPHLLYTNTIKLGEEYPTSWILECISNQKTPVLRIEPPNIYNPFQYDLLEATVTQATKLKTPMFIQLYPYSNDYNYNQENYIEFYQKAYDLFKKNAPNVALVWSVYDKDVIDSNKFYPTNDYTDWVSIILTEPITTANQLNNNFDFFYFTYQNYKPIMISDLSISHFSTKDMTYKTSETADKIKLIYNNISDKYRRVKAIIYKSYNSSDNKEKYNTSEYFENSLLTDESIITSAYSQAISPDIFTWVLETDKIEQPQLSLSRFNCYKSNNDYFISDMSLSNDLRMVGISLINDKSLNINDSPYFSLITLKKSFNCNININDDTKTIVFTRQKG